MRGILRSDRAKRLNFDPSSRVLSFRSNSKSFRSNKLQRSQRKEQNQNSKILERQSNFDSRSSKLADQNCRPAILGERSEVRGQSLRPLRLGVFARDLSATGRNVTCNSIGQFEEGFCRPLAAFRTRFYVVSTTAERQIGRQLSPRREFSPRRSLTSRNQPTTCAEAKKHAPDKTRKYSSPDMNCRVSSEDETTIHGRRHVPEEFAEEFAIWAICETRHVAAGEAPPICISGNPSRPVNKTGAGIISGSMLP